MALKLNKKSPYGTVVGDDLGRAYEQDGHFFDEKGNEWVPPKETAERSYSQSDLDAAVEAAVAAWNAKQPKP